MNKKKIQLGLIFYGNKAQLPANRRQYRDLKRDLTSFSLKKYDFNAKEHHKLLKDFKNGKVDIVLKNSYGRGNEADVEKFLEQHHIPYFGSGPDATLVGTNKSLSKRLFRKNKLPVANDIFIDAISWHRNKQKLLKKIGSYLHYPCIVKDVGGTDSRGLYLAKNSHECERTVVKTLKHASGIIIEEFINKTCEIACLVIGNKPAQALELVILKGDIFSAKMKDRGTIEKERPQGLSANLINKIKKVSILAHQALGCQDFSRSDVLLKGKRIYLLEMDVHPGFSAVSAATASANFKGLSLNDLFLKFYKPYVRNQRR